MVWNTRNLNYFIQIRYAFLIAEKWTWQIENGLRDAYKMYNGREHKSEWNKGVRTR